MKIRARGPNRGGFTLIEILVTLIMISGLIAFAFPVITQQLSESDAPRTGSDLSTVRSAVQVFNANTRAFPSDLDDLSNKPVSTTTTGDRNLAGAYYTDTEKARWNGPYFDGNVPVDDNNTTAGLSENAQDLATGLGTIESLLGCAVGTPGIAPNVGASGGNFAAAGSCSASLGHWVAVQVSGIVDDEFTKLNAQFDPSEAAASAAANGKLRYDATNDVAVLLIAPYR